MIENLTKKVTRAGRWETQPISPEPFSCFIPAPLPPNPPIRYDSRLQELEERASRAIGLLEGVSMLLPDPDLFLYMYIRKEAVLSSQIEGTQSSLVDLLLFEHKAAPGVPIDEVKEVSNYVSAMEYGLKRLGEGFPLSLRLLKEIHALLLKGTRGDEKEPGEFRRSQNWIGGSRPGNAIYVPPPAYEIIPAMGDLEKFLHGDPVQTPTLIKAGLAHAQFESIHPFLDGNGRIGRLLITLILCAEKVLSMPLLYLSLYFKQKRTEYYDTLQRVRTKGDWEEWLAFYLTAIEDVSREASETAKKIVTMFEQHRVQIQSQLGKAAATALKVHDLLKKEGIISIPKAQETLRLTFPALSRAVLHLQRMKIVREFTGKKRHRLFSYNPYLTIIMKGTET